MVRYTNLRIKLPFINFVSCIHHKRKDKEKEKEKKSKIRKKTK